MRWIRTKSGEKAHAVFKRHDGTTVCGINLGRAIEIVDRPGLDVRCGACDKEWRERGRALRPKRKPPSRHERLTNYKPRFKFEDS
jgi:hypothetical protein